MEKRCGLKTEETSCDSSDRDGTDFDDGICACAHKDDCNKYVADKPGNGASKGLKCYKTDEANGRATKQVKCPAPPKGKTAACLTKREG